MDDDDPDANSQNRDDPAPGHDLRYGRDDRGLRFPTEADSSSRRRIEGEHRSLVRERTNAAARPILLAYARSRGVLTGPLRSAIEGSTPLVHPAVTGNLGGALHCEALRIAIDASADSTLVPWRVRADLTRLTAQDLADPPSSAGKEAFPDWHKPLASIGHHNRTWHDEDAAAWLGHFPPKGALLPPMDTWDGATAAAWLDDRETIPLEPNDREDTDVVVSINASNPWKPSLEVLHTLNELELEDLAYRVFVERLRREVMPFHISERKIHVRNAIVSVTFGYQTLREARRSVHEHDLRRVAHFDRLFSTNQEWVYDLCSRILAIHAWPLGFSEGELQSEFPEDDVARPA